MTDQEKTIELFTKMGVKFDVKTAKEVQGVDIAYSEYDGECSWDTEIILDNGIGFFNFECCFYFLGGKFQNHGVWE